jgi:hypothetical protein
VGLTCVTDSGISSDAIAIFNNPVYTIDVSMTCGAHLCH